MPTLVMNDKTVEAPIGERLLDTARREAMHIGFVCDGNGLCQTCECLVLHGAEHLNPPNEIEQVWLTDLQIQEGRRLACQASLRGPGPVNVITRAEEIRHQWDAIFSPPPETTVAENVGNLLTALSHINKEHIRLWPFNMFYAMSNFLSIAWTVNGARQLFEDTWRISNSIGGRGDVYQQPEPATPRTRPALSAPPSPARTSTMPVLTNPNIKTDS